MSQVKVFWSEPTDQVRVSLRRFTFGRDHECKQSPHKLGCDATHVIHATAPTLDWIEWDLTDTNGRKRRVYHTNSWKIKEGDPRWPAECDACGRPFNEDAEKQVNADLIYEGKGEGGKGRRFTLREAPVGAMWDLFWFGDLPSWTGKDGVSLAVMTPGGEWYVDGIASNCTDPKNENHKCWVRHGNPKTGEVHVDKNGQTCSAGAGSIQAKNYHGFLHHGYLTDCP